MPPAWDFFAGIALITLVALLGLARATQARFSADPSDTDCSHCLPVIDTPRSRRSPARDESNQYEGPPATTPNVPESPVGAARDPTAADLLVSVVLTHGAIGGVVVAAAWYSGLPASALGIGASSLPVDLGLGAALGAGLYVLQRGVARAAERSGLGYDDRLRERLAPSTPRGWALLLLVVLPVVAGVEELLFRGALVGALAAGYGLSPWLLALASSVAFGLGHGLQGPGGVAVAGGLGFLLAAAFVATGSLVVVIVAHYLVNALEFLVHESVI